MRQPLITCLVSFNLFSPTLVNAGDLTALTNSVINGWRADYKRQAGNLMNCASN